MSSLVRLLVNLSSRWLAVSVCCLIGAGFLSIQGSHAEDVPPELQGVGISEHLGSAVTINSLKFKDEKGEDVALQKYFAKGKPVLLTLVYYECPSLCNYLLNGLVESLKRLDWSAGDQFEMVTVSINPREDHQLASHKKASYIKSYGRPSAEQGWHFLTGSEDQIKSLASQVGFGYRYDSKEKQYAHSAAIFILTPEGKVSRYLYGIDYRERDMRLALLEASNGKIGTIVDRFLMFCYRYDPQTRKYSVYLTKIVQTGGAGTVLIFGGYLAVFWRRQRRPENSV
jgi:protein SCO1